MVKLTEEIKKLIETTQLGFFATASLDGKPNVSPKGTIRVLDDEHLIFAEARSREKQSYWIVASFLMR